MWQETCPCRLCVPCTGEEEAAAGREHLGILVVLTANAADSHLTHQKRVLLSEQQFVLWDPWELSCLEEGARRAWSFPWLAGLLLGQAPALRQLLGTQEAADKRVL